MEVEMAKRRRKKKTLTQMRRGKKCPNGFLKGKAKCRKVKRRRKK